jgi:hypothetical protein
MSILDILASAMVEGTDTSKMLILFAIRKTISQEIHTEDEKMVEAHAASMGYEDWLNLLKDPEFYLLVKNASVKADPRAAIAKSELALIRKQSLFTMQAK